MIHGFMNEQVPVHTVNAKERTIDHLISGLIMGRLTNVTTEAPRPFLTIG